MPFQFFISQEIISLLKLLIASITTIFVIIQLRKIAEHLDGRRELHHYVYPADNTLPVIRRGGDDE